MELRWYQTYDKNGLDSEKVLEYREEGRDYWQPVEFVREREEDEE